MTEQPDSASARRGGSPPTIAPGLASLDDKIAGVLGGRTASALQKSFGMLTMGDLLAHYPRRYAKRGELTALSELPIGENVTIVGQVIEARERTMKTRRGSIVEIKISDGKGGLVGLTFFNQRWRLETLRPGVRGIFAGKITDYRGTLQLAHPHFAPFEEHPDDDEADAADEERARRWAEAPIPIYPASNQVTSAELTTIMRTALDTLGLVPDPVPPAVRREKSLLDQGRALTAIHRPEKDADWIGARRTLRYTEAFVLQAALLQQRARSRAEAATPRMPKPGGLLERFDAALPFALTNDQLTVGAEIAGDLAVASPMNRLVQGEVGSGKTIVALRAMLAVADSGGQSAMLAPTEVLASQHLRSIVRALGPELAAELVPTLLTGQQPVAERRRATLRAVSGQARIVVGTHALLGDAVAFYDLGLVVVDEQHRFGVDQREALRLKGRQPHVLVLTATPIPRTVAMTVFGDLDVSVISELPAGRPGIESFTVPLALKPAWEPQIWRRLTEELAQGRQGFVVCPAIEPKQLEDGEQLENDAEPGAAPMATVATVLGELRAHPALVGRRIEPLHGRMSSEEKESTMLAFAAGQIDVLVATTVIEVGVDVPNASMMVVLDADRFGVSQLHQLRGRIGRGGVPGVCLLVTRAVPESVGLARVEAVAATLDGFELAQVDLELRREGNVLGGLQSGGRSSLRLLRVATDGEVILDARRAAEVIIDEDPELAMHPDLSAAVERRLDDASRDFLSKN
ncbi:ATP-dependent DNA helicase RecG [Microterricola viridarii]|uniref:Probable DNA 3'-5' helicase RecG n=1 Tax=Microterricola viridarii TaxID=412690 RepID=A0A1H1SRH0_9MICO|nr:ATP-dependent DNA helicase RecG [Microterricola viridarii]SDS50443.1 ATP-dependent DNA helicase RecG [Microterricola viridarii]